MPDTPYQPLESLTRDQLELRLVAGLIGPDVHGPRGREAVSSITSELSDPTLRELVRLVEAPTLVEQRLRARLMLESIPQGFGQVTSLEGRTTTPESETR